MADIPYVDGSHFLVNLQVNPCVEADIMCFNMFETDLVVNEAIADLLDKKSAIYSDEAAVRYHVRSARV